MTATAIAACLNRLLAGFVLLHLLAAPYHQFSLKDSLFQRIWFGAAVVATTSLSSPRSVLHLASGSVGMAWYQDIPGIRMPRSVEYYFSFQSPWAYIGHHVFMEVAKAYDLNVNFRPVVLVDLFSETGGLPLMKRHPVRQRYRMVELQRWRDKRGLKFHLQPANWPFNARLADGVVIAANEAGLDPEPFVRRAFAAVWEDQLNLADPATLITLADASALPGKQLVERSGSDDISTTYEQNRQTALAADVFGSPGYVLDSEVFWGQDRIELLADALKSGRAPYRSQV